MPHQLLAGLPEGPETRVQGQTKQNKPKKTKPRQNTFTKDSICGTIESLHANWNLLEKESLHVMHVCATPNSKLHMKL